MSKIGYAILISVLAVLGAICLGCSKEPAAPPVADDGAAADGTASEGIVVEEEVVEDVEVPVLESGDVTAAFASLSDADRTAALAQKICPVSDEALGSMGTPLKVTVDGRDVFICCESCRDPLVADPTKYLAKLDAAKTP